MKKLKRILALFTVGILLLALTACGSTVSPTVLYNENGIKITSVRYSTTSNALGPQLTVRIENNSGRNITVQCRNTTVNGYTFGTFDSLMSVNVGNGQKATGPITFMNSALKNYGIWNVREVTTCFYIYEMDNYFSRGITTDPITIRIR